MLLFVYSIIYLLSFAASIWFLASLYKYRRNKIANVALWTFAAASFWFAADFFTIESFFHSEFNIFFWRVSLLASFLLTVSLFRFVIFYTEIKVSYVLKYLFYLGIFLVAYATLLTDYIIKGLEPLKFTGHSNFIMGPAFIYWGIILMIMLFFSIYFTVKRIGASSNNTEKKALKYFVAGLIWTFSLASIFNIILPLLKIDFPRLAVLGVLSLVIVTIFIIYKWDVFGFKIEYFNIRYKITITMVIVSLIPILGMSVYFYNDITQFSQTQYLNDETRHLSIERTEIESFLSNIQQDILFLSNMYNLNQIVNNTTDNEQFAKQGIIDNFINFSKQRKFYYQLTYIDESGQQIVNVVNRGGEVILTPEKDLQNKADRYYFKDTMKIAEGQVFISPLDLNIENGKVEVPHRPVIRYATPLFDEDGNFKGIVIANVDGNYVLDIVAKGDNNIRDNFLVNKDGYFLYHPQEEMRWGFMFDNNQNTIDNLYTNTNQTVMRFDRSEGDLYCDEQYCYIGYYNIYPGGYNTISSTGSSQAAGDSLSMVDTQEYYWTLFSRLDKNVLDDLYKSNLFYVYLIILFILVLTVLISLWVSSFISKPISQLKRSIEIITKGNLDNQVVVSTKDELKDLANDFNKMVRAIKQSRRNVDKKVEAQTRQIVQKSQQLEKQQAAVLNILEDVEDEKKKTENLAKDLEKFKLAVDNASDHIVITDENAVCLYANSAVERITGFSRKEILGHKVGTKENWGGFMKKEVYDKLWRTVKVEKKVYNGYVNNKRKSGEMYEALSSISPVLDKHGHVKFFVAIERDVTEEKKIDRAKSEFVSLASHQLRTPLSTINWYAEMLLSEDAGKLTKEQKEFTGEIYKGNQRMVDLVNSLLNVSRIELGTLAVDPKPTDLIEQAESVLDEIKPLIAKKKLKIIKRFDKKTPKINLDDKLMRIVWQNLLSNALKYTPSSGKITIVVNKEKSNAKIEVGDTGMGIPKNQQDKIFSKLFRADNVREKETDGTGLGLYIVKSVIDQFGGKIHFKSQENKGTTFFISIPLKGVKPKAGTRGLEYTK